MALPRPGLGAQILFDQSLSSAHQRILEEDLNWLKNLTVKRELPELKQALELSVIDGDSLYQWLSLRVRYIVGSSFDPYEQVVSRIDFSYSDYYEWWSPVEVSYPPLAPFEFEKIDDLKKSLPAVDSMPGFNATTLAVNVGTMLFGHGLVENHAQVVEVAHSLVAIDSPRVGIIQLDKGLLPTKSRNSAIEQKYFGVKLDSDRLIHRIFRLAVLFHEARHSDGSGSFFGFSHALCPEGHELENRAACDIYENGPYVIEAYLARQLAEAAQDQLSTSEHFTIASFSKDRLRRAVPSARVVDSAIIQMEETLSQAQAYWRWYQNDMSEPDRLRFTSWISNTQKQLDQLRSQESKRLYVDPTPVRAIPGRVFLED